MAMVHPKVEGKNPVYKLSYFDMRGRAEGARLLFHYAGVPFEDIRITKDQWPSLKPKTPFGQLPILEIDGYILAQSASIYRFLGKQFKMLPECPYEEAIADSVYEAFVDFQTKIMKYIKVLGGFEQGDKDKLEKETLMPACETFFTALTKFLEKTHGEHIVGKTPTWQDIVIGDKLKKLEEHCSHVFDKFPLVKKFADKVYELPQLQSYLNSRPNSVI